jgi:uncharacterized radical SAM superfamily Fe-S cluster-containing enzyme
MSDRKILYRTWSVCPVCLKRIPAQRVQIDRSVYLEKACKEHGSFSSIIWRGYYDFDNWINGADKEALENPNCPDGCGLCADHLRDTCCVILNITNKCNLKCRFCFDNQCETENPPSFEEIKKSLASLIVKDKSLVQLSGGEPTVRNDLSEIIRAAKETGAKYVQLNSNGIRLGEYKEYVQKLAEAGLSFVFLQFDGTGDSIYENLRGRKLLRIKQRAIENCAEYNIGVTLVPTLVRGINENEIGNIIDYAVSQSPNVRGVHFHPVTYIRRYGSPPADSDRITLDELIFEIEKQSNGLVKAKNLLPAGCDHPLCGFHGDFFVDNNKLFPLLKAGEKKVNTCCGSDSPADKNRAFVAKRWLRQAEQAGHKEPCCGVSWDMDSFLEKVKTHGFTITSMAFQDAGNLDFSRLRNCSLHVYDKGRHVPFCAYYLNGWEK